MWYWLERCKRRAAEFRAELGKLNRASKVETCSTHEFKKQKKKYIGSAIYTKTLLKNIAQELQKALQ